MGNIFYDCAPRQVKNISIERPHLLDLAPDELVLHSNTPSAPFSIMNTTSHWLAFKIQFTVPDKYYVKPGIEIVGPHDTKICEVGLVAYRKKTMSMDGRQSVAGSGEEEKEVELDKIRVKSVNVDMDFVTKMENLRQFGTRDDINKAFRELFESKDKQLVASDVASIRISSDPAVNF